MESKGISNELLLKQFNIKESIQTTESFQCIVKSLPKDNPKKLKDKNCSVIDKTNFTQTLPGGKVITKSKHASRGSLHFRSKKQNFSLKLQQNMREQCLRFRH